MTYDPYADLLARPELTLCTTPLLPEAGRYYAAHNVIILRAGLTHAAARSTLAHELVHADRGDGPQRCPVLNVRQERDVDLIASARLITLEDLIAGMRWAANEHELADELNVDVDMLIVRLRGLTDAEWNYVQRHLDEIEGIA